MSEMKAIYNIGVVARMTDIPAATLRIWERRYDFPNAVRTAGGHRLYTAEEIERLQWVKLRIESGMQTSQAIKALQLKESEHHADVEAVEILPSLSTSRKEKKNKPEDTYLATLQQRLFALLLARDIPKADTIFNEALASYAPEEIMLYIICPSLSEIGEKWEQGQINISTEHLLSHYLRQRLLMWMRNGPPQYTVPPTVLACAPGEWHEGGLMILGALLIRRRWPIIYLGQSVPLPDLAAFVQETRPLAVVLTAMTEEPARALIEWPEWLPIAAQKKHPMIGFGGRIFSTQPDWQKRVPGFFLGTTLCEGIETLEQLLQDRVSLAADS